MALPVSQSWSAPNEGWLNRMNEYTRRELVGYLRSIEANACNWQISEQTSGMDAAAFESIIHQAAHMLAAYQKPAISANRLLTLDELLALYDTDARHVWPSSTPPYLYREGKAGGHDWMAWHDIRACIEECDTGATIQETYLKTWRLWLCKPTGEERKAAPWDL